MVLDATVGGANANSYVTRSAALALLRINMEGDIDTPAVQVRLDEALIWATRLIEEQVAWYGSPVTSTQALAWPQAGVDLVGRVFPLTAIPAFLQQATAEYALALIRDALRRETLASGALTSGLEGVKTLTIDDVRIEVAQDLSMQMTTNAAAALMPASVRRALRPYGDIAGGPTVRLQRV